MKCTGWNFEMGTQVKSCRCRKTARKSIAVAMVEQVGRRWTVALSTRPQPRGRWFETPQKSFATERAAKAYGMKQLQTHSSRVCAVKSKSTTPGKGFGDACVELFAHDPRHPAKGTWQRGRCFAERAGAVVASDKLRSVGHAPDQLRIVEE